MAVTSQTTPGAPSSGPPTRRPGGPLTLLTRFLALREGSIIVVTVAAIVYFAITTSNFLTFSNFKNLLPYFCFLGIMAIGEVFVMTLGEIDLSIGALYLITPFAFWKLTQAGIPLVPSVILAILIAGGFGAINGFFTAWVGMPSFVATLAMLFFLDGLALIVSHSEEITTPGTQIVGVPTFAQIFGAGTFSELFWMLGLAVVLQIVLSLTRWGIYTVSVGGNRLGAAEAGINTRLVMLRNFMLSAMCAGLAGILEGVRTSSITPDPSGSEQFLLYAIAAVIIGGTVMTGGEGTVIGAIIGALFIGVLQDGLVLKSVNANYEFLYLGVAVIIAMTIYVLVRRVRRGTGRG
ncbi:MAG TPA: ABC transporter permease [Solirubrobacteraceae bacterium]|nr:ABC transporter permease [Solirubrobacteraceae bacterium]